MGRNSRNSDFLPNCNIARIFCHIKGALVLRALILPLNMAENLCYQSLPSYIIDSSPYTFPKLRSGIVHFLLLRKLPDTVRLKVLRHWGIHFVDCLNDAMHSVFPFLCYSLHAMIFFFPSAVISIFVRRERSICIFSNISLSIMGGWLFSA